MKYLFILLALTFIQCSQECTENLLGTYSGSCIQGTAIYEGELIFIDGSDFEEDVEYFAKETLFGSCNGGGFVNISSDCLEMIFEQPTTAYIDGCGDSFLLEGKLSRNADKYEGILSGKISGNDILCTCTFEKM